MNIFAGISSSANVTVKQMRENKFFKNPESINYWEPVLNPVALESIPIFPDYFDFLRKNQPGCYDFLPVAYVIIDETGIVKSANLAIVEMLGVKKSQLIDKNFFDYIHKEDQKKINLAASNLSDLVNQTLDIRLKKKDKLFWGRITIILDDIFFCSTGQVGLFIFNIDDLKQFEQENEKLKHKLEQTQKMEAIGELSSGIVHDFNNILHPIIGNLERLITDTAHDNKIQTHLENVLKWANRASTLVKQILSFGHREELDISSVKIQPIISEVIKLSRSSLPATIKIIQTIDDGCGPVMVDPTHIYQIAMNLITNASHAMGQNEGVLDVTLKEIPITGNPPGDLSLKPGTYVCLCIADTGEGIDASIVNRVFEPYFTTKKTGTGLGLSVISRIVSKYGGDVCFSSEPGHGSLFQVYLPRSPHSGSDILPTGDGQKKYHGCESILLVDDDPGIVEFQQETFEGYGYRVSSFVSSLSAYATFKAGPEEFDIVICDMTMPDMTGLALAIEVKQIKPEIPVILCTGFSQEINMKNYQKMGVDGFLMKPFNEHTSLKLIRHFLDKS